MRDVPGPLLSTASAIDRWLVATGVTPDTLTIVSLTCSAAAAVAFGFGWLALGGVLLLAGGAFDLFDGRVARASGTATPRGALLDSFCDRWGELFAFGGLAFHLGGGAPLAIVLAALAASFMVSYTRARAAALGIELKQVGVLQRPERILAIGIASILGRTTLVVTLAALAALGATTAVVRFRHTWRALSGAPPRRRGAVAEISPFVESRRP
jgi:phosphatidylglycerophosphate synthase